MPVKRRTSKLRNEAMSDLAWALLTDADHPDRNGWEQFCLEDDAAMEIHGHPHLRGYWADYGPEVVLEWAITHPGTRPSYWWKFTAPRLNVTGYEKDHPEPRRQISGGSGILRYSIFDSGLPKFSFPTETEYADPPVFESQASYLERYGLFIAGEKKRLKAVDYQPEQFDISAYQTRMRSYGRQSNSPQPPMPEKA